MNITLIPRFILVCGIIMYLFSACSLEKMGASAGKGVSSQSDSIGTARWFVAL